MKEHEIRVFVKQTAQEFLRANRIRVAVIFIAEMLSIMGIWKFFQHQNESRTS